MTGKRKHVFALTRIVFQRRLASSLGAITSSLARRHKRLARDARRGRGSSRVRAREEARAVPPDRAARSTTSRSSTTRPRRSRSILIDSAIVAETLERLRDEVDELERLVKLARETIALGKEAKLDALKSCLERAELAELKDGRGKLLIFTEHQDTLDYLVDEPRGVGLHDPHDPRRLSPQERKQRQIEFQRDAQICVATEAAGEGINLQFCHLMINYDMPWNPMRLEQRMGRIHRIGQKHDVYVFNFAATNTIEGKIVARLLEKLEEIRETLGDRVFDVIGELLKLNDVDFEGLLREAAYNPKDIDDYLERDRADRPGAAQGVREGDRRRAREEHVDLAMGARRGLALGGAPAHARVRRGVLRRAAARPPVCSSSSAPTASGAPSTSRSSSAPTSLRAVKRLGRPDARYQVHLPQGAGAGEQAPRQRAAVAGHPLFAAVDEVLNGKVADARQGVARFLDPFSPQPYPLHFFEVEVEGGPSTGGYEPATGTLVDRRRGRRGQPRARRCRTSSTTSRRRRRRSRSSSTRSAVDASASGSWATSSTR